MDQLAAFTNIDHVLTNIEFNVGSMGTKYSKISGLKNVQRIERVLGVVVGYLKTLYKILRHMKENGIFTTDVDRLSRVQVTLQEYLTRVFDLTGGSSTGDELLQTIQHEMDKLKNVLGFNDFSTSSVLDKNIIPLKGWIGGVSSLIQQGQYMEKMSITSLNQLATSSGFGATNIPQKTLPDVQTSMMKGVVGSAGVNSVRPLVAPEQFSGVLSKLFKYGKDRNLIMDTVTMDGVDTLYKIFGKVVSDFDNVGKNIDGVITSVVDNKNRNKQTLFVGDRIVDIVKNNPPIGPLVVQNTPNWKTSNELNSIVSAEFTFLGKSGFVTISEELTKLLTESASVSSWVGTLGDYTLIKKSTKTNLISLISEFHAYEIQSMTKITELESLVEILQQTVSLYVALSNSTLVDFAGGLSALHSTLTNIGRLLSHLDNEIERVTKGQTITHDKTVADLQNEVTALKSQNALIKTDYQTQLVDNNSKLASAKEVLRATFDSEMVRLQSTYATKIAEAEQAVRHANEKVLSITQEGKRKDELIAESKQRVSDLMKEMTMMKNEEKKLIATNKEILNEYNVLRISLAERNSSLNNKVNTTDSRLATVLLQNTDLNQKITKLENELKAEKLKSDGIIDLRVKLSTAENFLDRYKQEKATIVADFSQLKNEVKSLRDDSQRTSQEKTSLEGKIHFQNETLLGRDRIIKALEMEIAQQKKELLKSHDFLVKTKDEMQSLISKQRTAVTAVDFKNSQEYIFLQQRLKEAGEEVKRLKSVEEALKDNVKTNSIAISNLTLINTNVTTHLKNANIDLKSFKEQVAVLKKQLETQLALYNTDVESVKRTNQFLTARIQELSNEKKTTDGTKKNMDELNKKLYDALGKASSLEEQLRNCKTQVADSDKLSKEIQDVKISKSILDAQVLQSKSVINELNTRVALLQKELDSIRLADQKLNIEIGTLKEYKKTIEEVENQRKLLEKEIRDIRNDNVVLKVTVERVTGERDSLTASNKVLKSIESARNILQKRLETLQEKYDNETNKLKAELETLKTDGSSFKIVLETSIKEKTEEIKLLSSKIKIQNETEESLSRLTTQLAKEQEGFSRTRDVLKQKIEQLTQKVARLQTENATTAGLKAQNKILTDTLNAFKLKLGAAQNVLTPAVITAGIKTVVAAMDGVIGNNVKKNQDISMELERLKTQLESMFHKHFPGRVVTGDILVQMDSTLTAVEEIIWGIMNRTPQSFLNVYEIFSEENTKSSSFFKSNPPTRKRTRPSAPTHNFFQEFDTITSHQEEEMEAETSQGISVKPGLVDFGDFDE